MADNTQVLVRDKETGHEYRVSADRYRRTPHLWDRLEPLPRKPKTTVSTEAAKKKKKATSGHEADSIKEES